MRETWTAQETSILRTMVEEGANARAIATRLGRNRNQIIGKCRRLQIQLQQTPKQGRPRKRRKREKKVPIDPTIKHLTREQVVQIRAEAAPEPLHLRVENLEPSHCRWPFGERHPYTFCGHERVKGQSYCRYHFAKAQP